MHMRRHTTWTMVFILIVALLIVVSTLLAQVRTRVNKENLAIQELEDLLSEYPDDARVHFRLATLLSWQDRREEALEHFEEAIRLDPECQRYGNTYRMICIQWVEYLRCIEFFEKMVELYPDCNELRLNCALSYVDKMPWAKMGMVSQGKLSNKSMAQLTKVIEADSSNWAAWYARAMNHLHWPRAMKHAKRSIADFEKALGIQNAMKTSKPYRYFEYTYIGLGDALVKDFRHDEARKVWRQGLKLFPHSAQLRKRLSIADNIELEEWLKKARALEKQIDT
ncbi:MAG: tetratricopeptide repeat protein, partial [Candidatus Zixiibacteriota bacterium]